MKMLLGTPNSPDSNPLDYFFWDKVQQEMYQSRHCKPFLSMQELKEKIIKVWDECASDLQAVCEIDGGSSKALFG